MTLGNDGYGFIGDMAAYPGYRRIYMYTATRANIKQIFDFANTPIPTRYFFTLGDPKSQFDLINVHDLDGSYLDTSYEFFYGNFDATFKRDLNHNFLGPYFPKVSYQQFTPPKDQLFRGDFLAFTHIYADTFGVFWMTLNTTYQAETFTFHENNDKLTVEFTSPPGRGMAQVGNPYYLLRDSNSVNQFPDTSAINDREVNAPLGDSKILTTYTDQNNNFVMDRSGKLLTTKRTFK